MMNTCTASLVIITTENDMMKQQNQIITISFSGRINTHAASILMAFLALAFVNVAAAAPIVSLGCTLGGSGTLYGCDPTLDNAPAGSFGESASFTYSAEDLRGPSYYETTGNYSQGSFSSTSVAQGNNPASTRGIGTTGGYSIDGLILSYSGPDSLTSAAITMNLHVAGNVNSNTGTYSFTQLAISAGIGGVYADPSFNYFGGYIAADGSPVGSVSGLGSQIANGEFVTSFNAIITVGPVNIDVGTAFGVNFGFTNTASILGNGRYAYQSISGSGWLPGMQVFNTPAGFSVSSMDGLIVDNVFMPSTVPLPPAVWLFGSGLIGLVGIRRQAIAKRSKERIA